MICCGIVFVSRVYNVCYAYFNQFEQAKKVQTSQMEELQKRTANLQTDAESLLKVQQQL
jgi:hypothetical protein